MSCSTRASRRRGPAPGSTANVTTVFNGNLAAVEGAGQQPGSATAATPSASGHVGPTFLSHRHDQVQGLLYGFRARATGRVVFMTRAGQVAHSLGRSNSIRADQGQPPIARSTINIGSIAQTGFGVTISAPLSATDGRGVHHRPELPGRYGCGDRGWSRQEHWQRCLDRRWRGRGREFPRQRLDRGSWSVSAQLDVPGGKQHSCGSDLGISGTSR